VLLWGLHAGANEFRSGWFIESTLSELLVLFSLRTSRPMWASRPGPLLLVLSVVAGAVVVAVPFLAGLAGP
jgi:P-type Mg2+ transporter